MRPRITKIVLPTAAGIRLEVSKKELDAIFQGEVYFLQDTNSRKNFLVQVPGRHRQSEKILRLADVEIQEIGRAF